MGMDEGFIRRTYRSVAYVTAFTLFVLASYGQFWALAPVLAGVLLGTGLLRAWEVFVRRAFTPERAAEARENPKRRSAGRTILGFALVKYPLVALVLWAAARFWEQRQVMAFAGGVTLIYGVIALRAAGRALVDQQNANAGAGRTKFSEGESVAGTRNAETL